MEGLIESLDAMSAKCLLERYIEDEGCGALGAIPCLFPIPLELERFNYDIVREYIKDQYYEEPSDLMKKQRDMKNKKEGNTIRRI